MDASTIYMCKLSSNHLLTLPAPPTLTIGSGPKTTVYTQFSRCSFLYLVGLLPPQMKARFVNLDFELKKARGSLVSVGYVCVHFFERELRSCTSFLDEHVHFAANKKRHPFVRCFIMMSRNGRWTGPFCHAPLL